MTILEPDLVWRDGAFHEGLQVEIGADGAVARVGSGLGEPVERLTRQALLPGMVNAHSHAFQRGLRGKAETFGDGSGTFWSWREAMYRLANELDPDRFHRLTKLAYREMLRAGITTVGEFHYLHHASGNDYELDRSLVEAASASGIRFVALDGYYATGDVGTPLADEQRRFGSSSVDAFLESAERMRASLSERQSFGLVAHSLRAVPIEGIVELHEYARAQGFVLHIHVEEQAKEIEAVRAVYGRTPLALLLDHLELGAELTAVHCTHSDPGELARFLESGANVCICPLTEANLADGIPPVSLAVASHQLSLGTDSNLRIDFSEEMRLLEYAQRLREERRGVFTSESGSVAARLFRLATEGGARSLGVRAGRVEEGYAADFFTLDLDALSLREASPDELLTAWLFGGDSRAIERVCVSGEWVTVTELDAS